MSTDPHSHIVGSTDHRAQTATTLCGQTKHVNEIGNPGEAPPPGKPACAACYFEMFKLTHDDVAGYAGQLRGVVEALRTSLHEVAETVVDLERCNERKMSNLLDALESAEARLDALERKAKKGRRS